MKQKDYVNTVVISVSSINERDKIVKNIYSRLISEPSSQLTISQDQVNRIKVYHNIPGGMRVLVKTYLVVTLPIIIDLSPLYSIFGAVDFHLDETIAKLNTLVEKLQSIQGKRIIKENSNGTELKRELDRLLR